MNSGVKVVFFDIIEQALFLKPRRRDKIDQYIRYIERIRELDYLYALAVGYSNSIRTARFSEYEATAYSNASVGWYRIDKVRFVVRYSNRRA